MTGRVQRRFMVALGVSLALHVWLMQSHYGKGKAPDNITVAAKLLPMVAELPVETPVVQFMPNPHVEPPLPAVPSVESDRVTSVTRTTLPAATAAAVLSQPDDPNYYAAGDLDVFPKALVRLDLSAVLAANQTPAVGKVRATILIDEVGVVNAVRNVEASTSSIETAARDLLLSTRFTPARNKEGRIVKAQLLVALDYDTRMTLPAR